MHGETSVPFVNVIGMEMLVFSTAVKSEWYLHVTIELGFFLYTKKQIFVVDTDIVEGSSIIFVSAVKSIPIIYW